MAEDVVNRVAEAASKLDSGSTWMLRREIARLGQLLAQDERIAHMAQGNLGEVTGLVVATDRRLMFVEEGLVRHQLEEFPYAEISAVRFEKSLISSSLTVSAAGNEVTISGIYPKDRTGRLGDFVQSQIQAWGSPGPTSGSDQPREIV